MNNKGFVFIETIVVVAMLTFSLLVVYSAYNASINKEKARVGYNDPVYLYRTYHITSFLKANNLANLKPYVKDNELLSISYQQGSNRNPNPLLNNFTLDMKIYFQSLWQEYHVRKIYLSKANVDFVKNCPSSISGNCSIFASDQQLYNYIKTIDGGDGYRIIIEYQESIAGEGYGKRDSKLNFTTLSLGEI